MLEHVPKGGAKKTRTPGMFPSGVSGVRLGQNEDSTTDYLAQGKQMRLLHLLLLLVRTLVSLVFFLLTASALNVTSLALWLDESRAST